MAGIITSISDFNNHPANKAGLEQRCINVPNVYLMLIQRYMFQIACWAEDCMETNEWEQHAHELEYHFPA